MINVPDPQTKLWGQPNASDLFGPVFVTKNITFDDLGYLSLSFSPRSVMTEAVGAFNLASTSTSIYNSDYSYFTPGFATNYLVNSAPLITIPTAIATAGVPSASFYTGVAYFGKLLVFTASNDVDYYDTATDTWTDTNISLTASKQHQAVHMLSLNALAIVNVNTIGLYASPITATPSLITTLTIPTDFEITQVVYFNQNLYIATQNVIGGLAAMYVWNGQGTAAQQVYQVNSHVILSLCPHKNAIYALLGNGALERFDGGGFTPAAVFPIYYTDMALNGYTGVTMWKNIMSSNEHNLFINFNNFQNLANSLTYQPDGVWCYNENVGLYHRYSNTFSSPSYETILAASVNTGNNQITVAAAPVTGTEVYYNNGGGSEITGLVSNQKYYVIKIDATHISLALTYTLAVAGTAVSLNGTGNNAQYLIYFINRDYGQFYGKNSAFTYPIEIPSATRQYGTDLLWGSEVRGRSTILFPSYYGSVMTAAPDVESRGYFITQKMSGESVTENYNTISLDFLPFRSGKDKIIIKYRTEDDLRDIIDLSGTTWRITWTSSTTFTVTMSVNGVATPWASAAVGDEIEVLEGAAGGLLAHITAINSSTITIDETFDNYTANDISNAVFRNWKKWKTITYGDSNANQHFISSHLGKEGEFLQLKVELRGVQVKIIDLKVDNVSRLPASQR